ncbi:MAG: hypothetical protein K6A75_08990 [Ruminococcus sp.]|nr:hypothetical protein [Ruminococcus sp.]
MKKVLCGIIPLILVLVLCTGCGSMERVDYQAVLLDYLSNRYPDDTFTVDSNQIGTEGNTANSFSVYFRSENIPNAPIVASRRKYEGDFVFYDNYIKYYLKADMEKYVHDIAEKNFGECKVYMRFNEYRQCLPESFHTDATAEDYLKIGQPCSFDVVLPPEHTTLEDAREGLEPFKSEFEKRSFDKIIIAVYFLPDIESYEAGHVYTSSEYINANVNHRVVGSFDVSKEIE